MLSDAAESLYIKEEFNVKGATDDIFVNLSFVFLISCFNI